MFKKLKLTYHLLILYGFLGLFLLLLSGYSLLIIRGYDETIATVDREQLPLARTVSEISRHQLDQTLRFNEILLYARIHEREKYELSNERFVQAGKRMGDEILEGRNTAQRGIDRANSEETLKALDTIKTLLKGIEKAHGDYEHLGALLIRGIYQYDFLLKTEYLTSGDHIAGEEEANKHITFLKTNLSALEDETRRLESGIKESMERVKQLSQTLAEDSKLQREHAFNSIIPLLFFALSSALILVFMTTQVHSEKSKSNAQITNQALAFLANLLTQFHNVFHVIGPASEKLEQNIALQRVSFDDAVEKLKEMVQLSNNTLQLSAEINAIKINKNNALGKTETLVKQLNQDAGEMLTTGTETGRIIHNLKEVVAQINMLATNASAEAFRSDATRSFAVYTEEIMDLARSTVTTLDKVSNRIDDSIKAIHADRLHVSQTQNRFTEVMDLADKEVTLFDRTVVTSQTRSTLLQAVQSATIDTHTTLQTNERLLTEIKTVRDQVRGHVEMAKNALPKLRIHEMPEKILPELSPVTSEETAIEEGRDD